MTVSSETKRAQYDGNDVTVEFAIPFYFFADGDVEVYLDDTLQTLTTHYTVADEGEPLGGTLTMLTAPATGETLTIIRDVALTQGTDYVENSSFPADSHETALDRLTMISQQLQEEVNRALVVNPSDPDGLNYEIPGVADRAEKYLYFDASGNLSASSIFYATVTSDYWAAIVDDETLAASLTTMGFSTPVQASLNLAGDAQALYYAGSKAVTTLADGIQIHDSGTATINIRTASSSYIFGGVTHGYPFLFEGENISGVKKTVFKGDPDGAAELYHAGTKVFETTSNSVSFVSVAGTGEVQVVCGASGSYLYTPTAGNPFYLQARNEGGSATNILFKADPDGAAELYHAGTVQLFTGNGAVNIGESQLSGEHTSISSNAINTVINSRWPGTPVVIQARNTGGSATNRLWYADPDGPAELYYAGVKTFETRVDGVQVTDGTDIGLSVFSAGQLRYYNAKHGGTVSLMAENAAGSAQFLVMGDPDGAAELYYAGTMVVKTNTTGVKAGLAAFKIATSGNENGITLNNNGSIDLYYDNTLRASTLDDGWTVVGCLTLDEITTPTADADHGKVYFKADNKMYCQTGDGVEHEIAFV